MIKEAVGITGYETIAKIIDFFRNAVVPFDDKSARKLSLTRDSFYIGRDGLLYRNQKRGN